MKTKEIATFRKTYKRYDKQCYFEGLKLAVHFDEKDDVKNKGAQWDNDEKIWWMPEKHLTTDVHAGIGTVRDWLNDQQMIMGPYGRFVSTENSRNVFSDENDHYTEYKLELDSNNGCKIRFFYEQDVAKFIPVGVGDLAYEYLAPEDGRKRWNVFISMGYNRVENS